MVTNLIPPDLPGQALVILTKYVVDGEFSADEFNHVKDNLGQLIDEAQEQYDDEVYYAMRTIYEAFLCVEQPLMEVVEGVPLELIATASYALPEDAKTAENEEIEWILTALEFAEMQSDDLIRADMFDNLGALPPRWLLQWEIR
ncbi:hypothetical protein [Flagellimonas ruestringensis]|uniref:hypothetical protein n=1 Tax=Flagellimonas ruestringensis TaxID=111501 RepID=UPI0016514A0D|nr:hypothetical protein [Allomuricauda ruestringensis]